MLFVDNQEITAPSINIALETYLVENRLADEPMLLFYINEPSIIIGREIRTTFLGIVVKREKIEYHKPVKYH